MKLNLNYVLVGLVLLTVVILDWKMPSRKMSPLQREVILEVAVKIEENQAQYQHSSGFHQGQYGIKRIQKEYVNSMSSGGQLSYEKSFLKEVMAIFGILFILGLGYGFFLRMKE